MAEKIVEAPLTLDWYDLLEQALREPGELAAAHRFFHKYSLANRWLASTQLRKLGLPLLPINTFGTKEAETGIPKSGWLACNRHVKAGEKACISLISPMPVTKKKKDSDSAATGKKKTSKTAATGSAAPAPADANDTFVMFRPRRAWFHMGQTDGEDYIVEEKTRDWNATAALEMLEIGEQSFEFRSVSDTRLGYAEGRAIAISPLEEHPTYGRVREMARVVLGHTELTLAKNVPVDAVMQDVEAETTAYLVAATLGFSGMETSQAKLQEHLSGASRIPEKSAQRAFSAADKILNAGYC